MTPPESPPRFRFETRTSPEGSTTVPHVSTRRSISMFRPLKAIRTLRLHRSETTAGDFAFRWAA